LSDKDIKELSEKKECENTSLKSFDKFNKKDIVFEDENLFVINKSS
jgi:23S rRNA-/tRNA-specific pseudouridylate synthase